VNAIPVSSREGGKGIYGGAVEGHSCITDCSAQSVAAVLWNDVKMNRIAKNAISEGKVLNMGDSTS
jgi:hypothetical protein